MIEETRFYDPNEQASDEKEFSLRPKSLDGFVGQEALRRNLNVFIEAAKQRDESLEHVLFMVPLVWVRHHLLILLQMKCRGRLKLHLVLRSSPGDLAAILTNLSQGDILFIDEIHRLNRSVEEVLYPAMEDFELDIVIVKACGAFYSIKLRAVYIGWGNHSGWVFKCPLEG